MAKSKSDISLGGAEQNMSREELAAVTKAVATLSPEEEVIDGQDRMKREQLYRALRDALENQLTSAQRHRLWLYAVDGLTEDEIASREQIRQQSVSRRINAAKKILKKFLKRWV